MADITLRIRYPINEPEKAEIHTNAKKEAVEEILSTWIREQMGQGEDLGKPSKEGVYDIQINLYLDGDRFVTRSNTGNKSLTAGIVSDVFRRLHSISIQ